MNNKKLVIFSFVSLILFGLVLNFVFGVEQPTDSSVAISVNDVYNINNWTKGGENATVNFTLTFNPVNQNISNITILIPGNVLVPDLAASGLQATALTSNGTDSPSGGWACWNGTEANTGSGTEDSNHSYVALWECWNTTADSAIINLTTMNIWFNYTANTTGTNEDTVNWTVIVGDDKDTINYTSIYTNIDYLAPRLTELNISDGYTVLKNSTDSSFSITAYTYLEADMSTINNGTLRGDGSVTVEATFEDAGAGLQSMISDNNVYLYYLTNDTKINETDYENVGGVNKVRMTKSTSNTATPYKFTGTITGLVENNITTFLLLVNDSFNNQRYVNYTDVGANEPFAFLANTTNVPLLSLINISDGAYTISATSGAYLKSGAQTITINATGRNLFGTDVGNRNSDRDGVFLYYNTTGNLTTDVNGYVIGRENSEPLLLDNNSISGYSTIYYTNSSFNIVSGNDTNTVYYAIVANTTKGTYYTLLTGEYTIDDNSPTVTSIKSDDTDDRISVGGSITFTCDATDGGVGVNGNSYVWKVTRGGEGEESLNGQTSTLTLSSTSSPNTNKIDTYTIKCLPYDLLGNLGVEKSTTITVSASSGGTATSSAGGGSSSSTTTPSFDVDLSTSTTGSISGSVGRIKSFSFDGSTKHTVTFKEITATSAKITIASTPIDVVLNIGETKKVDINSDGTDDLEVTLDNIKFGTNAEITINKLETGAKKVVTEETKITETGTTEETKTTGEPTKGTGWLWVTILIIVVLVTVGYYVFKKK